jgi:hypothetical protein
MKAAPDPDAATPVHGDENGHYRLQPLPRVGRLVDLDAMGPGTPGLNETWADSGQHPRFRDAAADVAGPAEWAVRPENLVSDSGFDEPMGEDSGWIPNGGWHSASGMACANLAPNQTAGAIAKQQIGVARAGGRYVMYGDVNVSSRDQGLATVARMYIAAGPELKPVGAPIEVRAEPGQACHWDSRATEVVVDGREGEALYIVIDARMDGAAESAVNPAGFARWDDVWVLGN